MRRAVQISFTNSVSLLKRLNETGIWLLIILKARMAPEALVAGLAKENRDRAGERLPTGG